MKKIKYIIMDIHEQGTNKFAHTDKETINEFLVGMNEIENAYNDGCITESIEDDDVTFIVELATNPDCSIDFAYDEGNLYIEKISIEFEDGSEEQVYIKREA